MDVSPRNAIFGIVLATLSAGTIFAQRPPETPKRIVTDTFFGRQIEDPYRWLENIKDPYVLAWLKDQNTYTRSILDKIPDHSRILNRIRELDGKTPPPPSSFTLDERGRYYFFRSGPDGLPIGYVRDPKTGKERLLIDPKSLAAPGEVPPKVSAISPSPNGRYIAFLVRDTSRSKVYIMDVAAKTIVGKPVENVLGFTGLDWDPDSKGIYIVKLPPLTGDTTASDSFLNSAAYHHILGTDPAADQLLLKQGENTGLNLQPTNWPFVFPLPDGKTLAVWIEDGARNGHALYEAPRSEILAGRGKWKKIADFDDGATHCVFHGDKAFLTMPVKKDGRSQVFQVTISGSIADAKAIALPNKDQIVSGSETAADALYVTANESQRGALYRLPYRGKTEKIKLPLDGTVEPFTLNPKLPGGLFKITAWTRPAVIYRYDPKFGWLKTGLQPSVNRENARLDLQVELASVLSHDGVAIPLTVIYRRGLKHDGSNPTLMIGYGSYGATIDPFFDNVYVPWFEAGGVLAFTHVRGGGEFGEAWHKAGSKDKKPNTWLDFIASAKYLIDQKYTSPACLAGGGTSAGGILIGRAITERPDLFRAALINVATTDMLRAEYQMNGPANIVEFGTVKDKTSFEQLYEMSSYHHVKDGVRYPAVLLSTGMKDTNVDVWQAAKMAARMQAITNNDRPVLLRVDPDAGHDQWGSTRNQIQELRADQLTFLLWQMGVVNSAK